MTHFAINPTTENRIGCIDERRAKALQLAIINAFPNLICVQELPTNGLTWLKVDSHRGVPPRQYIEDIIAAEAFLWGYQRCIRDYRDSLPESTRIAHEIRQADEHAEHAAATLAADEYTVDVVKV